MFSRIAATIAEKARNRFPSGASRDLWMTIEKNLQEAGRFDPAERVTLKGQNGQEIRVSRLAMGTGSDGWLGSSNQTRQLGMEGLSNLLLKGYHDHGLNFWDSADQYGSHPHVAQALKEVEREDVVILTKTVAESPTQMQRDLDRFRRELDTDYIDILLLHCMTAKDWPKKMSGVMDIISKAQEEGIVRLRGVSCHSFSALKTAAETPWVELDLARINPSGKSMDAGPDEVVPVLKKLRDNGKHVMGMKIFGNGRLADNLPGCLRFALGLNLLDCMTIGFEQPSQLDQVVKLFREI